jgi:hypothetical protein
MAAVGRLLALVGVFVCVSLVAAACGDSSSSTAPTAAGDDESAAGSATARENVGRDSTGSGSGSQGGDSGGSGGSGSIAGSGGSSGSGTPAVGGGGPGSNDNGAPLGSNTSKNGDNSIQTYGTSAEGAQKAATATAMRSFILAIADRDYAKVCAGLAQQIRSGLAQSDKPCPELLKKLLIIPPAEARRAANGTVTNVRVGGGNAFVLFRPVGADHINFFVLTVENGEWKSLGLTIGSPVDPSQALPE